MKPIQLFDIKTRTLGFAFCQPPKKSLLKSLTQKKSLQNFKPKKSPQIANFKPKKGLRTSPSLIYLSTPPGVITVVIVTSFRGIIYKTLKCLTQYQVVLHDYLFLRVVSGVLAQNSIPGAVCSLVCGGAEIG